MREIARLEPSINPVKSVVWEHINDDEDVTSEPTILSILDSKKLRVYDLISGKVGESFNCAKTCGITGLDDKFSECAGAKQSPHHQHLICHAIDDAVVCWDMRSSQPAYTIEGAHQAPILDLDFNPNKPYSFCTGGEDCNLRFWDIRKPRNFFLNFEEDSHWVTNVKYNRFHDQLVLSASSSTYASLWKANSCSSAHYGVPMER